MDQQQPVERSERNVVHAERSPRQRDVAARGGGGCWATGNGWSMWVFSFR